MSNDETKSLAIVPRTFAEVTALADVLAKSSLLPLALRGKVPEVAMTVMAGQELGIPPMAALRSIHVIEGKTVLSADIMSAVVQGNRSAVYVKRISASHLEATYETLRRGETEPRRQTWTIDDAKRAGLYPTKDNWRQYPRAMLAARAKSELLRDAYPDSLAGCYTQDEIEDFGGDGGGLAIVSHAKPPEDVIDADFVDVAKPATVSPYVTIRDQLIADIAAASTIHDLEKLQPRFGDLPRDKAKGERLAAHEAYKAREAAIMIEVRADVNASVDRALSTTSTEVVEASA